MELDVDTCVEDITDVALVLEKKVPSDRRSFSGSMSFAICGRILTRSFLRKRSDVCNAEMDSSRLERTYTLFDLLCVGIGLNQID